MKRLFVLILSVLCMSLGMQAKDNSVAYVDMAYILKNLPQYETANEQLTMIAKRWQKEVDALEQEIRVMTTNYQTEQIFLSEDMRQRREEEILQKEQEAIELKRKYFGETGELVKKREALLFMPQFRNSLTRNILMLSKTARLTRDCCTCRPNWITRINCCRSWEQNK